MTVTLSNAVIWRKQKRRLDKTLRHKNYCKNLKYKFVFPILVPKRPNRVQILFHYNTECFKAFMRGNIRYRLLLQSVSLGEWGMGVSPSPPYWKKLSLISPSESCQLSFMDRILAIDAWSFSKWKLYTGCRYFAKNTNYRYRIRTMSVVGVGLFLLFAQR